MTLLAKQGQELIQTRCKPWTSVTAVPGCPIQLLIAVDTKN